MFVILKSEIAISNGIISVSSVRTLIIFGLSYLI